MKSGRARPLTTAKLDYFGIVGDRRLMVVDHEGGCLTQRTVPALARVEAEFDDHAHTVALFAAHMTRIHVNLRPSLPGAIPVTIWSDRVHVIDLGEDAAHWLSICIGHRARLVTLAPEYSRPVRHNAMLEDEISFTDGFPLLVVSESSLASLNERLDTPVLMDRFRPNIVVDGCQAFAEDTWKHIRIGDCVLRAAGPCSRCVITTTDQESLISGMEPLKTLARFRRGPDGKVNFGQNYIHETKHGTLSVGDAVEVMD